MSDVNKNNNNHANYYGIKSLWLEVPGRHHLHRILQCHRYTDGWMGGLHGVCTS